MAKKRLSCVRVWKKADDMKREAIIFDAFPSDRDISGTVDFLKDTDMKDMPRRDKIEICKIIRKNKRILHGSSLEK